MMKKKVKCANCGKEFEWEYFEFEWEYFVQDDPDTYFCSMECANEY